MRDVTTDISPLAAPSLSFIIIISLLENDPCSNLSGFSLLTAQYGSHFLGQKCFKEA